MLKVLLISFIYTAFLFPQNSIKGIVKDEHSGEPVPAVNVIVKETLNGSATNVNGEFTISNIPDGSQTIIFSHIGYQDYELALTFPLAENFFIIELEEENEEIEEIMVNATRSSRTIENEPVRVEVIAGEEIDEKLSMDPSNISMMLNESTGIQVQQTSAAAANNSFRIQGLEGRYTQLLKDGFPLYSGFSGSLSIVQIPPLDLQQIEIIKGSSSVLYGGGAIAGLINLITKLPGESREISLLANATSALGFDLSGFYSEKFEDFGVTLLASRNIQRAYDNNDDNFSDIPEINRYSVNPRILFYLSENSTLETSADISIEERKGGSIPRINNETDSIFNYLEENSSDRFSGRVRYTQAFGENNLSVKYSSGYFNRDLSLPDYSFNGRQLSSYGEASFFLGGSKMQWVFGLTVNAENFTDETTDSADLSYDDFTPGVFIQNSFDISEMLVLESGIRTDYNKDYKWFILPSASLLIKHNEKLVSRIGGGLGYKIPTIFTERAEEVSFRNIIPLNRNLVNAEKSWGANFDVNFRTILFDEITLSINQLFFYTRINNPLILNSSGSNYSFETIDGYRQSKGTETNLKFTLDNIKLFTGYAFKEVTTHQSSGTEQFPLSPKHWLSLILIYEEHDNFRIGFESYFTGKQKFENGNYTRSFWINGLMVEKKFSGISLFLNFENFLDVKQSNYAAMYTGSPSSPIFAEIYAPTEGRIINGGVKIKL